MKKNSSLTAMNFHLKNLIDTRARIDIACQKANRLPSTVMLLAVSKTKTTADIRAAHSVGQQNFGENYLQEALEKIAELQGENITWHYIGSIQSNKTKAIAENFAWVHSLSNAKHATRLANQRPSHLPKLNICLQINIDREENKSGLLPDAADVMSLVKHLATLDTLKLRGLMVIPAAKNTHEQTRMAFRQTRELFDLINASGIVDDKFDTLSMGMSNDLELAIQEGATIVRIGTAIFGKRNYQS